ncbi:DMT family transporter, partial [Klebsiella variicola]
MKENIMKNILILVFTLTAFAANSILCRIALKGEHIDPVSFSNFRLLSGAIVLFLFQVVRRSLHKITWNIQNSLLLSTYVFTFSLSYIQLEAATGALLLFGSVQVCMVTWGTLRGEKIGWLKVGGILLAITGIFILLLPGARKPPIFPASIMVLSGIAWAIYSIRGRKIDDASGATAGNFILSIPLIIAVELSIKQSIATDVIGLILAIASGAIASGIAYVLWYTIIPRYSSSTASTLQLSVPCIAAAGGAFFIGEIPDIKMIAATFIVLAGITMVIAADKI